ncbi:hypothetical protein PG993_003332 [Apiospora rasikravindrae]|uniref:Uncharacterized protein n=1 Tax=Apiospora rasikravindrae TaxID=990691 RepID=A0ABR1TZA0_9PEZI
MLREAQEQKEKAIESRKSADHERDEAITGYEGQISEQIRARSKSSSSGGSDGGSRTVRLFSFSRSSTSNKMRNGSGCHVIRQRLPSKVGSAKMADKRSAGFRFSVIVIFEISAYLGVPNPLEIAGTTESPYQNIRMYTRLTIRHSVGDSICGKVWVRPNPSGLESRLRYGHRLHWFDLSDWTHKPRWSVTTDKSVQDLKPGDCLRVDLGGMSFRPTLVIKPVLNPTSPRSTNTNCTWPQSISLGWPRNLDGEEDSESIGSGDSYDSDSVVALGQEGNAYDTSSFSRLGTLIDDTESPANAQGTGYTFSTPYAAHQPRPGTRDPSPATLLKRREDWWDNWFSEKLAAHGAERDIIPQPSEGHFARNRAAHQTPSTSFEMAPKLRGRQKSTAPPGSRSKNGGGGSSVEPTGEKPKQSQPRSQASSQTPRAPPRPTAATSSGKSTDLEKEKQALENEVAAFITKDRKDRHWVELEQPALYYTNASVFQTLETDRVKSSVLVGKELSGLCPMFVYAAAGSKARAATEDPSGSQVSDPPHSAAHDNKMGKGSHLRASTKDEKPPLEFIPHLAMYRRGNVARVKQFVHGDLAALGMESVNWEQHKDELLTLWKTGGPWYPPLAVATTAEAEPAIPPLSLDNLDWNLGTIPYSQFPTFKSYDLTPEQESVFEKLWNYMKTVLPTLLPSQKQLICQNAFQHAVF